MIIHIGDRKTGSTTLQNHFFNEFENIIFFHGYHNFITNLIQNANKGENVLVSDERLSGNLMKFNKFEEFKTSLLNIKSLFHECSIIYIVREQVSWLNSWYGECLKSGLTLSPKEFVNYFNDDKYLINEYDLFYKNKIEFIKENFSYFYIAEYSDLFDPHSNSLSELGNFISGTSNTVDFNFKSSHLRKGLSRSQALSLLFFNNIEHKINSSTPFSLNNSLFKTLRIRPKEFCSIWLNWLKFFDDRKIDLGKFLSKKLRVKLGEDWSWSKKFIKNSSF